MQTGEEMTNINKNISQLKSTRPIIITKKTQEFTKNIFKIPKTIHNVHFYQKRITCKQYQTIIKYILYILNIHTTFGLNYGDCIILAKHRTNMFKFFWTLPYVQDY